MDREGLACCSPWGSQSRTRLSAGTERPHIYPRVFLLKTGKLRPRERSWGGSRSTERLGRGALAETENMLEQLLIHQPKDPIPFMIDHLQRDNDYVPKIIILGPPASGKTTIAMWLAKHLSTNLLSVESLIAKEYSPLAADARMHHQKFKGWILDGIPETREQALMIQTLGISPRHVRSPPSQPWETLRNQWKLETTEKLPIRNNPRCGKSLPYRDVAVTGGPEGGRPAVFTLALSAPDTVLIERNLGKRIDPQTGEIYHTTFDWPPESEIQNRLMMPAGISEGETARKLLEYHRNIVRILPSYPKILKVINADQPCVDVFYQALTYVQTSHRSNAPFTPRVLLCGPVGSGKSLQAALLAQKYGLINVCCGQLLKEAVADKSKYGEMIQPFFEKEIAVPDNIIMKVLKQRLDQQDCVERGWVLHGFPRDLDQAHVMDSLGYKPNRVFFLNVPLDSVIERLTLRRTDPVTGERYHLMYKPPPTMEVQARLLQNPKESEEQIKLKMDLFYRNSAELEQFYGEAITLNGDQDPYTVFEYIESGIINPLPKKVP
ncbi:adenylate kinase 8 isoform X2 [Cervus elaphus]|uniref:adenylate kinase 8 isoform X2 n=1 Tax=Cervus elaphus TaxID=9860 RepID=UPI001CC31F99|nr:adenylate kinase 8 isoform X2 [Cervus elaphus]